MKIFEDGKYTQGYYYTNHWNYYSLSSIKNKTISFEILNNFHGLFNFTLFDITQEITTSIDMILDIIPEIKLKLQENPIIPITFNIEKIKSEQTIFFLPNKEIYYTYEPIGNGYIEYCSDEDCFLNKYKSSKVIYFRKGSKYKIKINNIKIFSGYYNFINFDGIKYSGHKQLNNGAEVYNIDKSSLDHFYIIDGQNMQNFYLYSKLYTFIKYSFTTKELINNLPNSLDEMEFNSYSPSTNIDINSDYILIILRDNEKYDKNIIYLYNQIFLFSESFKSITLSKGNYSIINCENSNDDKYFFISIDSSKPILKSIEDIDSFEKDDFYSLIINQKLVLAYNEDEEDVIIKMRYYKLENNYNYIKSMNNYKLDYYMDEFGNSDSLFLRVKSHNYNYYGFATWLVFDLNSDYYLYFRPYYGKLNVYKYQIDDNTNLTSLLGIIKSYDEDKHFSLINDHLSVINGSLLFSTYIKYGFFGDIYIQKVNDNQNVISNKNDTTGSIVKLLKSNILYTLDFNLNHLIKLHNDFSDATVKFYDINNKEIATLDIDNRTIELNGENIKIKSNKNALIYFYSVIPSEKKLHEIIFEKDQMGKNMYFSIINKDSDNEYVYFIKDYGFGNHYPMLNLNSWDKILIEKAKTTKIYIENPYDKLKENDLDENEKFIIYIANSFDEDGKPYFEEEKFEIKDINYNKNLFSKFNQFDFQVIEIDEEGSIVLNQANKNNIKYQLLYCNDNSYSYDFIIDYSNSNVSSRDEYINSNKTYSFNLNNNEIMSHKFREKKGKSNKLFFSYSFNTNINTNSISSFTSSYDNKIDFIKAVDKNLLEVKFTPYNTRYYKFYIIVSTVDNNNNLDTFNQICYLTQLITENINSNYSFNIYYYDSTSSYILGKIDISNLNANTNGKFVMNIINEDLTNNILEFNSALEFIPETVKDVNFYNSTYFDLKKNNYFRFNYTDEKNKEFLLVIKTKSSEFLRADIYIEGTGIFLKNSYNYEEFVEIPFNLTKIGIIYIKIISNRDRIDNVEGEFLIFPLKKKIDIVDFNEKIYFFEYNLYTKSERLIFIYNILSLTEDKIVYFAYSTYMKQFEVCDLASQQCQFVERFYKFLSNKEYSINVYSYGEIYTSRIIDMSKYIFGIFTKDNLKYCNEFRIEKNNEPTIYIVEKKDINHFYYININTYLSFYYKSSYEIDKIFDNLINVYFRSINDKYEKFDFNFDDYVLILSFPNFNYRLKSYENFVIGFSNNLFIVNEESKEEIIINSGENAFAIVEDKYDFYYNWLKKYYNTLRIVKSQTNNIRLVDYNDSFNDKYWNSLMLNSVDEPSNFIYIDKSLDNNIVQFLKYEPRYSYFYALDEISLKNRIKIIKEKGYNSYFKRLNSDVSNIYDVFNRITFDLEDKVNIYIKRYYGYSNIYEVNSESYDTNNLLFLTKPIKTYENEKSMLNKLFSLDSNKLFSGYLDYETLYDIYIDIDNEDNIVKMQIEDNSFKGLIKLFKPNINYKLDFEVNHLIKLDLNFDAQITITDSEKSIILNKNNPTTKEIKGNNVHITTNINAILYFYSSISAITSSSNLYKNLFQYEIEPINEKNLLLNIIMIGENSGKIHYLIDIGFEGYAPIAFHNYDIKTKECDDECLLYFQNYYDKLKINLVEGEKLFVYYSIESKNSENIQIDVISNYYSSLNHINNPYNFFVIQPNTDDYDDEEEKNLIINFNNKEIISVQAHYCINNDGTMPLLIYEDIFENYQDLEDSETYIIEDWTNFKIFKLTFSSNNEFFFSYSFHDLAENIIKYDSNWGKERTVNDFLDIKKAEIDFNNKFANVQFIPNYMKSSTKYFIIIGPKNDSFTLEYFNDPCFIIKLITENSIGVKIYEVMSIGEDYINTNIDISDLISQNNNNQEFIVNIVSQELRFEKKLNFYNARLFEKTKQIQLNEDIIFEGENLYYELEYSRPNNVNETCILFYKPISNLNSFKVIIEKPNLEIDSEIVGDENNYLAFECTSDGSYSINIRSLSKDSPVKGSFKIVSTGIPFNLDISEINLFYIDFNINYQPSPLIINIDTSKLSQDYLIQFYFINTELHMKDEYSNNMTINNQFFLFEQGKKYQMNVEFSKLYEDKKLNVMFKFIQYLELSIENLTFGIKNYNNKPFGFIKINYKNTPKVIFKTDQNPLFSISYLSESNYNSFPHKIQEFEFKEIVDLTTVKPPDFDYGILFINFDNKETSIEFIDGRTNINIELDKIYDIDDEYTYYKLNFDSIKDIEILIVIYNFDKEYSGEITIKNEDYNNKTKINNKLIGTVYFEVPTKKIYEFCFKYLNGNSGSFKIVSTGNIFKMDITQDLIKFDEMIIQKEPSPLIFTLENIEKDYIKKLNINSKDPSKIISIKKNDNDNINILNNYYTFENNNKYIVQLNLIKNQDIYILKEINIQSIPENNIQNLEIGELIFTDKIDKFIKINHKEISSFEIINIIGEPHYFIAYINETQYNDFPRNINKIKFNELNDMIIKRHANYFYTILILSLNDDKTELLLNQKNGPSYADFNSNYSINKENNSFFINYEKPFTNDEIMIIDYFFNVKKSVNVFIERPNVDDEIITINNKNKGNINFNVKDNGEIMISFKEIKSNSNNEDSLSGTFKILLTGKLFIVDIEQNIIEFDELKSSSEPSPLIFTFDSLNKNYIKKINIKNGEPSKVISIKNNDDNFKPINSNYYTFERNNIYSIQLNFQKIDETYLLNGFQFIYFSEANIEYLSESKVKTYNEIDIDKFILFNFNSFSKLKAIKKKGAPIFNKAIINENQYNIFPRELQNIKFEKLDNNNIEIEKQNDVNYGVLMINLNEKVTEIEFKLENDDANNGTNKLSTFAIVMISISYFIFIVILGVVIRILIKKSKIKENDMKFKILKNELIDMSTNDEALFK